MMRKVLASAVLTLAAFGGGVVAAHASSQHPTAPAVAVAPSLGTIARSSTVPTLCADWVSSGGQTVCFDK